MPHRVRGGGESRPKSGDQHRERRRGERQGGGKTRRRAALQQGNENGEGEAARRSYTEHVPKAWTVPAGGWDAYNFHF